MNESRQPVVDVERFRELGYWSSSEPIFDAYEVGEMRAAVEAVYRGERDDGRDYAHRPPYNLDDPLAVKTLNFASWVNRDLRRFVTAPKLVRIATQLLGVERIRLWQDQAIWKPGSPDAAAGFDGNVGLHQDFAYWQDSSTTNMVSANIALQDTDATNGALRVIAGSHRSGLLYWPEGFFDTELDSRRTQLAELDAGEEVVIELPAGHVSFHHSLMVHWSGPNTTSSPRLSIAPAFMPDGTTYVGGDAPRSPHSRLIGADLQDGMLFAGDHFPLLDPAA